MGARACACGIGGVCGRVGCACCRCLNLPAASLVALAAVHKSLGPHNPSRAPPARSAASLQSPGAHASPSPPPAQPGGSGCRYRTRASCAAETRGTGAAPASSRMSLSMQAAPQSGDQAWSLPHTALPTLAHPKRCRLLMGRRACLYSRPHGLWSHLVPLLRHLPWLVQDRHLEATPFVPSDLQHKPTEASGHTRGTTEARKPALLATSHADPSHTMPIPAHMKAGNGEERGLAFPGAVQPRPGAGTAGHALNSRRAHALVAARQEARPNTVPGCGWSRALPMLGC